MFLWIGLVVGCAAGGIPEARQGETGLAPCPDTPNCVSSGAAQPERRVAPIGYEGTRDEALRALLAALRELPRTEVVRIESDRVRAVQRSRVFGFVDDIEVRLPADEPVIHVRSASRAGYYDFGVNRRRVERLREAFGRHMD